MKIGLVYPQTEFDSHPSAVREYAVTAEESGFNHILTYEHVLGANPVREEGFSGAYTYEDAFLSPFLLFSYMAAVTQKLEFATGVLILPQRQTALVAKQAATLDILSEGRLRLGIGGADEDWVEYVLEPFTAKEREIVEDAFDRMVSAVEMALVDGFDRAMNEFNR